MEEEYYIDFDGVIMNTQDKIDEFFWFFNYDCTDPYWNELLANIDWNWLLEQCNEINNSIEKLKELLEQGKKAYILSRVFSQEDADAKEAYLRRRGVNIKVIPVFGRVPKSSIIKPEPYRLLIDDSIDNINDWEQNGGKALYVPKNTCDIKFLIKK